MERTERNIRITSISPRMTKEKRAMQLKRRIFTGTMIFLTAAAALAFHGSTKEKEVEHEYIAQTEDDHLEVNMNDLNKLGLVFVNDGMDSSKYSKLIDDLTEQGLSVKEVYDSSNLSDVYDKTIVSFLDYNDSKVKVIGQYNERDNAADPLAISMASSFKEIGQVGKDDIQMGVHVIEDGITKLGASSVEKNAGNTARSFVSLAVPSNYDSQSLKENILTGLTRYVDYMEHNNNYRLLARMTYADHNLGEFLQNHGLALDGIGYDAFLSSNGLTEKGANHVENDETFLLNGINSSFTKEVTGLENQKGY